MYFNVNLAFEYKSSMRDSFLVYLHPQRTGGTRLKKQLYTWYGRECCYTQQTVKDGFKDWKFMEEDDLVGKSVYAHHSDFWEKNFSRKCYYIATIRHPVYRLFSFYHYCKKKEGHALREMANKLSPESFLIEAEKIQPKYIRDFQTLRLCRQRDAGKAIKNIENFFIGVVETDKLSKMSKAFSQSVGCIDNQIQPVGDDASRYDSIISKEFVDVAMRLNPQDVKLFDWVSSEDK